jgi:ribosomal-protein-alanine N-acetyltransferase
MGASDVDPVLALERTCFSSPWSRNAFLSEMALAHSGCFVAKTTGPLESGLIIAYVCTQRVLDELSILKIAVKPEWRSRGVGACLLRKSIEAASRKGARKAFLEVRPSNRRAVSFYRRQGFDLIGTRPHYYPETGEDALIMVRGLEGEKS